MGWKKLFVGLGIMFFLFMLIAGFSAFKVKGLEPEEETPPIEEIIEEETPPIEEEIPEEEIPPEPTALALWIEENILSIIISTTAGSSVFAASIGLIVVWLKRKTKELKNESVKVADKYEKSKEQMDLIANYIQTNVMSIITNLVEDMKDNTKSIASTQELFNKFQENVKQQIIQIENSQDSTLEILKMALINDVELVKNGIAQEIAKVYHEAKDKKTQS